MSSYDEYKIKKYGLEWHYAPGVSMSKNRASLSPNLNTPKNRINAFVASVKKIPLKTAVRFLNEMEKKRENNKHETFKLTNDWELVVQKTQSYITPRKFSYNPDLLSEKEVPELRIYYTKLKDLVKKMKKMEEKYDFDSGTGKKLKNELNEIFGGE